MQRKPLVWKLFPIYFLITLVSVLLIGLYASNALRAFYYSEVRSNLEIRTRLISEDVESALLQGNNHLPSLVKSLSKTSHTRITIIDTSGKVIADSESDAAHMENHADRPEFKQALKGKVGISRRSSPTLGITMMYLAIPVKSDHITNYIMRTSIPAAALDAPPHIIGRRLMLGVLLITLLAAAASMLAARRISGPLLKMKDAAASFAKGDFHSKVPLPDTEEFASLANTLNHMAVQLEHQVKTTMQQAAEQQSILASMNEGVIAIDNNDCVLILNPMAEQFLGVTSNAAKGKTIQEAIRNSDLQRFFEKCKEDMCPDSEEFVLPAANKILIEATGTPLLDAEGKQIGVLVVLSDITRTRKLENIRKDFVANVSHELRTPITSIKGFVETLREGAISDPVKSQEFLDIVAKQADRLNAIIEDLLALSKLQQESDTASIPLQLLPINEVLIAAIHNCDSKAQQSNITMNLECDDRITALINAPLLEQAVTNLIDNAIKYSPSDTSVMVKVSKDKSGVVIRVTDIGSGIEAEHIPRLFERFYRVDKARSRKLGGTGLGLAIVKHIVNAHQGKVEVQSTPGKGSTFSITLPLEAK